MMKILIAVLLYLYIGICCAWLHDYLQMRKKIPFDFMPSGIPMFRIRVICFTISVFMLPVIYLLEGLSYSANILIWCLSTPRERRLARRFHERKNSHDRLE